MHVSSSCSLNLCFFNLNTEKVPKLYSFLVAAVFSVTEPCAGPLPQISPFKNSSSVWTELRLWLLSPGQIGSTG